MSLLASHSGRSQKLYLTVLIQTLCILLVVAYSGTSLATIFACPSGDTVIFQDRPCPMEKQAKIDTQQASQYPLSIHESWFERPEQAVERAFCDRRGCECGQFERKHQGDLATAVADALYLDGSWHRYESSHQAWLNSPAGSAQGFDARDRMLEASCQIMMSQTLLRKHASDVVKVLAKQARTAEERGFDVEQPCLEGIEDACELFDAVHLYKQLQKDASALRMERGESMSTDPLELTDPL